MFWCNFNVLLVSFAADFCSSFHHDLSLYIHVWLYILYDITCSMYCWETLRCTLRIADHYHWILSKVPIVRYRFHLFILRFCKYVIDRNDRHDSFQRFSILKSGIPPVWWYATYCGCLRNPQLKTVLSPVIGWFQPSNGGAISPSFYCLVVWNMNGFFFHIQLRRLFHRHWRTHMFQRGIYRNIWISYLHIRLVPAIRGYGLQLRVLSWYAHQTCMTYYYDGGVIRAAICGSRCFRAQSTARLLQAIITSNPSTWLRPWVAWALTP